ncbi:Gfo/Idh/MocA family protein [Oricola sp.]|uniref:Gfo/Idh/MocA family protein n=1 Tax=Oricola sp. TaxID=1979950 RepID=UPI003BAD5E2D
MEDAQMEARRIRWGILSTGMMACEKMVPAIARSQFGDVVAIASRDADAARMAAQNHGIARFHDSYDSLIADPEVDAIYNPLPTRMHVPVTLAAARAGKHVLCEKPIAMDSADASLLAALRGSDVQVMEAFMIRHHPQWLLARSLVRAGELGPVRAIQSSFCYRNDDPVSGTNRAEDGGGALLYVGCYPIVVGRFIFECEPLRILATSRYSDNFGTDTDTTGVADFGDGRHLSFHVSTATARNQSVIIMGGEKHLSLTIPYNTPETEAVEVLVDGSGDLSGRYAERHVIPTADHYALEADALAKAVLGIEPLPYGIDDALANMRALDAARLSARENRWVDIENQLN